MIRPGILDLSQTGLVLLKFCLEGNLQMLSLAVHQAKYQIIYIVHHLCFRLLKGGDGGNAVLQVLHSVKTDDGYILSRCPARIADGFDSSYGHGVGKAADSGDFRMSFQTGISQLIGVGTEIMTFLYIGQIVFQTMPAENVPIGVPTNSVCAGINCGRDDSADISVSFCDEIFHLSGRGTIMIYLHTGIGLCAGLIRQNRVDKNHRT